MEKLLKLLFAAVLLCTASVALAADKAETKKRVLTPEEKAQKASRHACKVEICKALAGKTPPEGVITCDIVKTWREDDIQDMVGDRISWVWGKAVCKSKLELKRRELRDAMTKPKHEVELPTQTVQCRLDRKSDEEPYEVVVDLAPKVTFKNGKATEASINWGDADAPLGIYPLIYTGTGLDNQTNMLGPEVVKLMNEFSGKKCPKVLKEPIRDPSRSAPSGDAPEGDRDDGPLERRAEAH